MLMSAKADPNVRDKVCFFYYDIAIIISYNLTLPKDQTTPLHLACKSKNEAILKILLSAKVDINVQDKVNFLC